MKRTVPTDPETLEWLEAKFSRKKYVARLPENEYEALMETLPHENPLPTSDSLSSIAEGPVTGIFAILSESELELLYALLYEGLSLRKAGQRLNIPKTTLARRRDEVYEKVEKLLTEDPIIQKMFKDKVERYKQANVTSSRFTVHRSAMDDPNYFR